MASQTTLKDPSNRSRLVGGLNRFAFRLFRQLCEEESSGNLFLSPSSVAIALAMVHLGAKGKTKEELDALLGYSLPEEERRTAFRDLIKGTRIDGVEFRSANRLWGQSSYQFLDSFVKATQEDFGAAIAEVDFRSDAEAARNEINAWIEEQTANRIQGLIPPDCVDDMTRLVLVNAVYFLGAWERPFTKECTHPAPFFLADGRQTSVPTMHRTGMYSFAESRDLKVLRLPYESYSIETRTNEDGRESYVAPEESEGCDLAMEVLLPSKNSNSEQVAELLATEGLQGLPTPSECEVSVCLPKYRVDNALQLGETLKALGVHDAFSVENANFSAMSEDPDGLVISEVVHKAFVDVKEEGTEAAAATAVFLRSIRALEPPPPFEFKAERPFVFLIRDKVTGLVHFIGRMAEPSNA